MLRKFVAVVCVSFIILASVGCSSEPQTPQVKPAGTDSAPAEGSDSAPAEGSDSAPAEGSGTS